MDPTFLPAWRLAELVRGGAIGCLELLDHYIARVERLDSRTNAVVVRDFDRARERARALDRQRRDGRATPLFGVPMTVKESFNLAGLPTTWGYEQQRNSAAHEDALAVQRLTAAGAVVFGKTNVPVGPRGLAELQSGIRHDINPWNLGAYAGRFVRRRRRGDGGGVDRRSRSAATSAARSACRRITAACSATSRVGDCAPARGQSLMAIAGDDRHLGDRSAGAFGARTCRWRSTRSPAPIRCRSRLASRCRRRARCACRDLRIAVWSSEPGQETDAETTALIDALAEFLERRRCQVSRTARPEFDADGGVPSLPALLAAALSARSTDECLARMREAKARRPARRHERRCDHRARGRHDASRVAASERARAFRSAVSGVRSSSDWDVLLCPVISHAGAAAHAAGRDVGTAGHGQWPHHHPTTTCCSGRASPARFHLPASVAPIGMSKSGLPIGVQIVGPFHGDRTTIHVAGLLEQHWRSFVPPSVGNEVGRFKGQRTALGLRKRDGDRHAQGLGRCRSGRGSCGSQRSCTGAEIGRHAAHHLARRRPRHHAILQPAARRRRALDIRSGIHWSTAIRRHSRSSRCWPNPTSGLTRQRWNSPCAPT